jgi:hypothetical protein
VAVIDLDVLDASIAESEKKNFFVAPIVKELIAELRHARGERAAVLAFLRSFYLRSYGDICADMADIIERGEHRREEEP